MIDKERPDGIIVQFGGQTPLKLATPLQKYLTENPMPAASGDGLVKVRWGRGTRAPAADQPQGQRGSGAWALRCVVRTRRRRPCAHAVQIWGTQPDSIDEAEDRDRWMALLQRLEIRQPAGGLATNEAEALAIANKVSAGQQA